MHIFNYTQAIEVMYNEAQSGTNKSPHQQGVVMVRDLVTHKPKIKVFQVGNQNTSHINIKVSLVRLFKKYFSIYMGVSPNIVLTSH